MYTQIGAILAVMILAYGIAKSRKLSVELSMLAAAAAGGIMGALFKTPHIKELARHLVEIGDMQDRVVAVIRVQVVA